MKNLSKTVKNILKFSGFALAIVGTAVFVAIIFYLYALPAIVQSQGFLDFVKNAVKDSCNAELILEKPVLKTSLKMRFNFSSPNIMLTKDGNTVLSIENLESNISFRKILQKQIILNKLGADDVYVDINQLNNLTTKENKENKPFEYRIRWFNSVLYLKKCIILYRNNDGVLIKLFARDLEITKQKNPKYVHFSILTDIEFDNKRFRLMFKDFNTIYFKNRKINIDNFRFIVDKSMVKVNGFIDDKNNFKINVSSDKFNIQNVKNILDSNLIIPNGKEVLACFKDLNGDFNFNFNLTNTDINGSIKVNKIRTKLIPLANIPLAITKGTAEINSKDINLKDFDGYYGSSTSNKIQMFGYVKNYAKTATTMIALTGDAKDELARYISKVAGCKFNLKGLSKFAFRIDYDVSGKVSVGGGAKIPKGADLLIENSTISSSKFDRALGVRLNLLKNELTIEHINYYISDFIDRGKPKTKPLVKVASKINVQTGYMKELEFDVPEPLPSEFFNVLVNKRIFRNGTFSGALKYNNVNPKNPHLDGNIKLADVSVVGQGLIVKRGSLNTTKANTVHLNANGRFRRTNYKFDSDIQNKMLLPVIVKNIDITLDDLDVEKVMQTFGPRPQLTEEQKQQLKQRIEKYQSQIAKSSVSSKYFEVEQKEPSVTTQKQKTTSSEENSQIEFQPNLVAIRNCKFNVKKGKYKGIKFGDLHANLTLTEKGILEIKSNKFNFADGISTLKVYCDMAKQKYSIRLGAKDVDSDIIATSTLNLSREISGKASALLEFYTDKDMKLNGRIQFAIKDGSIAKLGLVQYILNMAAIFRNPVAMISPSTLFDLVNVPDGTFSNIHGDLRIRNNVIDRMMIKSSSPQLSSFIVGQINLTNFDSSLRIYTKFSSKNKGFTGFLRNFSLNSLAKRTKVTTEEVSYYASELSQLPKLETGEEDAQVFLTKVDGDVQSNNFISSLKKIK